MGMPGMGGGFGQMMMGMNADFSVTGYSSDSAMTSFVEGTASITEGSVFEEGTANLECIISSELATYNSIAVGDSITFTNPNNEDELYEFTVVSIYTDSTANESSFSFMGSTSTDPANAVYMSYEALNSIVAASEDSSTTLTDEDTGREYETALSSSVTATYVFPDVETYEKFESEARALGLSDEYTISSSDIKAFENSLTPLNTLSKTAGYFLLVILGIGAIVLVVLNIFNVRERKYEIGVLCAMGMKKGKVAAQFLTEIFAVTLAAVIIGIAVGGVAAVPVANALLEGQMTQNQNQMTNIEDGFGRDFGGNMPGGGMGMPSGMPGGGGFEIPSDFGDFMGQAESYVTEINSAMNFTVVLQMLGIAVGLTLIAGIASMLFVMRYEPLKILANRD
ncbi:MAG: ABC transporter permease, partial [Clostridia bacterium]|nr:ABC transporter permease [Clostridia bacterium]